MASASPTLILMTTAAMLCGCDQASSDLATIKTARSLTAERGLVAELGARSKLRRAYSDRMQRDGVKQLVSARAALSAPDGVAGQAIGAAATLPDKAGALRAAARRLAKIETQREDH
jgi:hypothetical protein